jgi:hypothetical protein
LRSQIQSTHKEKKKSEENTSRKNETLHREEIEIESICSDHEEEYEDCVTNRLEKLNARKNKKNKNEASEHFIHQKNDRQCQLS